MLVCISPASSALFLTHHSQLFLRKIEVVLCREPTDDLTMIKRNKQYRQSTTTAIMWPVAAQAQQSILVQYDVMLDPQQVNKRMGRQH